MIPISPFLFLAEMPVPRDIALPLPLENFQLQILIVVTFLAHILFVNLMVGGSVLTAFFEILGRKWKRYDALAYEIAKTVTVNKSIAVVLGVAPLLIINLLYTLPFYSANALTGHAWILLVPLVTSAFLFTYLHKYSWHAWGEDKKKIHIAIGVIALLHFLAIPLIFLSNINLMLFPDKWMDIQGFFTSLQIGNVFPRYFHFFAACLAVTGLFLVGYMGLWKGYEVEKALPEFDRTELKRLFYGVCLYITIAQFVFGPLLLLTLPRVGISIPMLIIILCGAFLGILLIIILWHEVNSKPEKVGRFYILILALFSVIVLAMGTGRHLYREVSLTEFRQKVAIRTADFASIEKATQIRIAAGLGAGTSLTGPPSGETIFKMNCAACHAVDKVLAAPPLMEVYSIYKDNPDGIVTWASGPGKKRPQFAQMPTFKQLGKEQLKLVAEYMLQKGGEATAKAAKP